MGSGGVIVTGQCGSTEACGGGILRETKEAIKKLSPSLRWAASYSMEQGNGVARPTAQSVISNEGQTLKDAVLYYA